jgi:signal peptidase I
MLLSLIKTKGHSMEPVIKNGSFFIVSSIPYIFLKPKIEDLIVFEKEGSLFVKRITEINAEDESYCIEGDNISDTLKLDGIDKSQIKGKVLWIF